MRVTNYSQTQLFIQQMLGQQASLADLREQVSSGYKVSTPSESPGPAGVIAQFQTIIHRLTDHKDRMSYAENLLTQQEAIVSNSSEVLVRAKEIATQASNESYSVEQRRNLATEVWALRRALISNANTVVMGRYIYGGIDDDDPPVVLNAAPYTNPASPPSVEANQRYNFVSDPLTNVRQSVRITDGERINVTSTGEFFQGGIDALERLGRALEGYRTTPELTTATPDLGGVAFNLPTEFNQQTAAIRNAMDQLDVSRTTFQTEFSDIGARMNRITQAREITELTLENTEANRSQLQDADIAETASNLANLQANYQALLSTGAQINRLSLLDFL